MVRRVACHALSHVLAWAAFAGKCYRSISWLIHINAISRTTLKLRDISTSSPHCLGTASRIGLEFRALNSLR